MKTNVFKNHEKNSGSLVKSDKVIIIKSGRWIDNRNISNPIISTPNKIRSYANKNVYFLPILCDDKKGIFISLNFWQNQRFLFMQKSHWLQKEENIRYIVNLIYLTLGISVGLLNYFK